ncbi:restriction endonuclease subunit S [Bacillus altitudinis]|uniref:restriction endonuclease subunit S n=1 Tax=Bacillus altitudinis TaxID=293387 RepID=UPI003D22D98E
MGSKRVPEVRFKGFSDEWEEKKLRELASFAKGNGYSKSDLIEEGEPIILYGRLYTKYQTVIEEVDTFTKIKEKSLISKGYEVIVPSSGETSEDISRASVVKRSGVILGGDLNVIYPSDEINSIFLALTISNGNQQKELSKKAQGKSVVHLHNSDLKEVNLYYPKKEEQVQIGNFFKQLDETIAFQQQELDTLKQTKQGFLQKMFPKEGESVPEIRFSGFSSKWCEQKLKKVFKDFIVPMRDKPKEFSGTIPWTRIEDIEGRFINGTTSGQYVSEEIIKSMNLKIMPKGSLIVSSSATFGIVAIVTNDLITNQTFIGLVPKDMYDIDYLYVFFKSVNIQKKMKRASAGSTIFYISRKQFEEMIGSFPTLEEQTQIGNFFKQLDETIALHEQELNILKQTKKAFLQKMFV